MNGTSAEILLQQYRRAHEAIGNAIQAVAESAPHERDYYVQRMNKYPSARAEHDARLVALHSIKDEFEAIAIAIQNQQQDRKRS